MAPIDPITAIFGSQASSAQQVPGPPAIFQQTATGGFGDLLASGLHQVDAKVANADALMQAYAQGEAVPVHQVTLALEQARLAVELAVQVRARLVETYRDFMNMQL